MAVDAVKTSSSSPSSSHFSQPRQYYVAVDRPQFKMVTLVDLLRVASKRSSLPVVLCCSSRDELDAVCSAVSNLPNISLDSLYSDLAEAERMLILDKFRQATMKLNHNPAANAEVNRETGNEEHELFMMVVTDACIPHVSSGESSIFARVLINHELPTKKETYLRRMATCSAADGIVINMVAGAGEVMTLKNIEESTGLVIEQMPIDMFEIL
ncbi:ATP-dependent RNA helicase FAL1-like [Macadamia integrifolia]|uniref:ATP-dependent RNA helicase FAL1-like n=1 Tax=Macadamia integrifolia TaxID=60698 RepID=UPI001C4ED097|nr:ATP-dependent RNA helicase FAL1-like [Macadamia integrifolia]